MSSVIASGRYWMPIALACLCLLATSWVGPVVGYVLIVVAFFLLFEGTTAWFSKAGGTGGLENYKQ